MTPHDPPRPVMPQAALPEGPEAPPPGVRTMAAVRWGMVALMAAVAVGSWVAWAGTASRSEHRAARYQCPMHPAIVQASPGTCPVCGMDLVRAANGTPSESASAAPDQAHGQGKYWCPMHPEVTSDDPEARCEKCGGMKLLPRPATAAATAGAATPGLVPVQIGAERTQRIGVRTAAVERRALAEELRTIGVVQAREGAIAIVSSRVTGWVEDLVVKESGGRVRKGQPLATIYSPELLSAQQGALAAPSWSTSQNTAIAGAFGLDTGKRLRLLGVGEQDAAELRRTGQIRYALPVRSPIDGYVARRSAFAGQYVQPGLELFQIVDLSSVWVIAEPSEDELGRVRAGQRARVTFSAYPGETFTGRVDFVYPAVSGDSRTLQARIVLPNPELKLRPGMFGEVVVEGAPVEGLVVPSEAVADSGERQYVFVARDGGRFEPRLVKLGLRADDRVQVLEGLAEGDRVVTTANFLVDSESRLRAAVEGFVPGTGQQP